MAVGRPKTKIDYKLCEDLANIFCTQDEIASIVGVSTRTLQRDDKFCHVFKKGKDGAKSSLRRKQFKLADNSAAMAIFLGKQYLGQRDSIFGENEPGQAISEIAAALRESYTSKS